MTNWTNCWYSLEDVTIEQIEHIGNSLSDKFIGIVICNENGVKYAKMVFAS